jgi:stearoyl-CoA desaturase (Delta-9 desaturase)
MGKSWPMRIVWGAGFVAFYAVFATATWQWALVPFHWIMGAVHGAIVNWGGHSYGYRNFPLDDRSRNTLPVDFLTGGELFQNNHHKYPMSPNFAARWFEIDTTYQVMRVLQWLGIIDMSASQKMRYTPARAA